MLEVLFACKKIIRDKQERSTMGRGRPKKKPSRRRSAKIEVYLPKSKKQWIKDCAKGQGMSMSRYIEKALHRKGGRWPNR
jgi:predicted DNA binding CopG/RHH family protein